MEQGGSKESQSNGMLEGLNPLLVLKMEGKRAWAKEAGQPREAGGGGEQENRIFPTPSRMDSPTNNSILVLWNPHHTS